MISFNALVQPLSSSEFLRSCYGQGPRHFKNPLTGDQAHARFTSLFNWQNLNQLLSYNRDLPLRILKNSLSYIYQRDDRNFHQIMDALRGGGTLILDQIDRYDARLGQFLDGLSSEVLSRFALNLYLSQAAPHAASNRPNGYPIHFDSHDFLILQVYGSKEWEIYPRTLPAPLIQHELPDYSQLDASQQPPPPEDLISRLTLEPGDVLYVPKGYWHRAQVFEGRSLHLTLGFHPATGNDLLTWLFEIVKAQGLPEELPLLSYADLPLERGASSPYAQIWQDLQQQIERVLQDRDLNWRYHQHQVQAVGQHDAFSLPAQYCSDIQDLSKVYGFTRQKRPLALFGRSEGVLELCYPHEKLVFAAAARPVLEYILAREAFSCQELQRAFPALSWEQLAGLLLPLVQDGLLTPQEGCP